MSHTPLNTRQCPVCDREDWELSTKILANYEGCAGLNPAAFRAVVEALKKLLEQIEQYKGFPIMALSLNQCEEAIAQLTETL